MKFFAFSDLHEDFKLLDKIIDRCKREKVDFIVCCGDITIFGRKLKELLDRLKKTNLPIFIIPGNHEDEASVEKHSTGDVKSIHLKAEKFGNYYLFGYGTGGFGSIDLDLEKFMATDNFVKNIKNLIFVSHGPAYRTNLDSLYNEHVGSKTVREFIIKYKPIVALSGHIHETAGKEDKLGRTRLINPGWNGVVVEVGD